MLLKERLATIKAAVSKHFKQISNPSKPVNSPDICIEVRNKRLESVGNRLKCLYETPESLVKNEGWFPYFFEGVLNANVIEEWLRKNKLPTDLYEIKYREVYPIYQRSAIHEKYWKFLGFNDDYPTTPLKKLVIPQKFNLSDTKTKLANLVQSNIELLKGINSSNYYLPFYKRAKENLDDLIYYKTAKRHPETEPGFFITDNPLIASTDVPQYITVLHSPSMIRHDFKEPNYLEGIIKFAQARFPDVSQTGTANRNLKDELPLIDRYFIDHAHLPRLFVMEENTSGRRVCSWGNTDLNELLKTAKQIIQQNYVVDATKPLSKLKNGNPYIGIAYHNWKFFLDKEGNINSDDQDSFNRMQHVVSLGNTLIPTRDLSNDVIWNRIKLYQTPCDEVDYPNNYKLKWIEVSSAFLMNGNYWKLQAHHSGEVTDMAVVYRYPNSFKYNYDELIAYCMGPAYIGSGVIPTHIDLIKHTEDRIHFELKDIEQFKVQVEDLVVLNLRKLKEKPLDLAVSDLLKMDFSL